MTGRAAHPGHAGWMGRLAALVRGLLALAVLAGLLAGIPAALFAVGADPLTVRLPSLERVRQVLTSPDDGTVLIAVLRVVGWAGWAGFAMSVVVETVAAVSGWTVPMLRGLAGVQRPAAYLVAAVAAALAVPAAAAAAAHAAPAAAAQPETAAGLPGQMDGPRAVSAGVPAGPAALAAPAGVSAWAGLPGHTTGWAADRVGGDRPADRLPVVRVGRYDSLWRLAERHLGDGRRWPEIYRLNTGRRQPDGLALADPDQVEEGWTLLLPADAVDAGRPADGGGRSGEEVVVVAPGDTLSELAEHHLGHAGDWPAIFAANLGRPQADGGELSDPDMIRPGWQLRIPAAGATRPAPPAGRSATHPVYEVVPGDRLVVIAERFLGRQSGYREIAELNRPLIRDQAGPRGPDHIESGWRLILPTAARDAGSRQHAAGRVSLPLESLPPPSGHPPSGPATPAAPGPPAAPSPTTGRTAGPPAAGSTSPTAGSGAPATAPARPAPSGTSSPAEPDRARPHGWVELTGGWVSIPLAAAPPSRSTPPAVSRRCCRRSAPAARTWPG